MDGLDRRRARPAAARRSRTRSSAASAARIASARPGCSNGGCSADASISCSGSCRRWRSEAKTATIARRQTSSSCLVEVQLAALGPLQLARRRLRQRAGCTSITSRGGSPHTSSVRWWMACADRRRASASPPLRLGDDDDALLALVALHAEGDDVAGAHAVERADGPLDVLREHVAAADDDDVLDPPAQHELAVEQVAEVAGAQPAVVEQLGRGVGTLVVAGRHRRAPDQQLADVALGPLLERLGVDDAHLQARAPAVPSSGRRRAVEREVVGIVDLDRLGDPVALEHDAVDGVAHEARGRAAGTSRRSPPRPCRTPGTRRRPGTRTARRRRRTPRRRPGRRARRPTAPASATTGRGPCIRLSARVASTHAKFGPAVAVPRAVGDPLHPVAGVGQEVLRGGLHEVGARSSSGWPGSRRAPCRGTAAATTRSPRRSGTMLAALAAGVDVGRRAPGRGSSRPSARSSSRSCTAG